MSRQIPFRKQTLSLLLRSFAAHRDTPRDLHCGKNQLHSVHDYHRFSTAWTSRPPTAQRIYQTLLQTIGSHELPAAPTRTFYIRHNLAPAFDKQGQHTPPRDFDMWSTFHLRSIQD